MFHQDKSTTDIPCIIFVVLQTGNRANGGVESITQVIEHCQHIKPVIVTQMKTEINQRWRDAGADVEVWHIPRLDKRWQNLRSLWETNQRMYQLVQSCNCSVIHCNDHTAVWHTAFGAKLARAKVVFNIRDIKAPDETYDRRWQVACRVSDRQLLLSQEMRQRFIDRLAIPPNRQAYVDFIYSIINSTQLHPGSIEERQSIRAQLNIPPDIIALGYVAAFSPKKAQLPFLEQAGPLLKHHLPNAKLYFVGDFEPNKNPYAQNCLDAVKRLGLEQQVSFVGFSHNIADWYKIFDLMVIASRREGLARCMIESLACGIPVVSFDVCSAREILAGHDCGVVIEQGDYKGLVQAIVNLAQNQALQQQFSENGAQIARELFQPKSIVQRYKELYFSLIELAQIPSISAITPFL